jgi:hypothetical protein
MSVKTKGMPLDEIISVKSSVQLYRLISRENLHLRRGLGRDDALLEQLTRKLNLDPNKSISKQLETRKVPLEIFVQAFFSVTEPFARMLSNIYSIMGRQGARLAAHSIKMKFSFQKATEELEFDLKHFREWLAIYQKIRGTFTLRLWSQDDISMLHLPIRTLQNIYGESYNWKEARRYSSPLPEPRMLYTNPEWIPLRQLRDAMEQLREIASEETDEHFEVLSALTNEYEREEKQTIERDTSRIRTMLSDLWPGLVGLLSKLEESTPTESLTRDGLNALQEIRQVLKNVQRTRINGQALVRNFVEFLRLPFWKYRWRVYEIWVMLEIIDCLDEYNITLELAGDRWNLEEHNATIVARFEDHSRNRYEVWTQLTTPVDTPYKKKHIMPDIRFCKRDATVQQNTLLLVECKQRKSMKPLDLEDLIEDYRRGANKSILNLFVDYDKFPAISHPLSPTELLSNVNPANPSMVQEFKDRVKNALIDNEIKPAVPQYDAILFDVSQSMRGRYANTEVNEALRELLMRNSRSKTFFFNNYLLPTEQISSPTLVSKLDRMTNGMTNLDGALSELHAQHPNIKTIAIVTDGEYDACAKSLELFEKAEELILEKNFPKCKKPADK